MRVCLGFWPVMRMTIEACPGRHSPTSAREEGLSRDSPLMAPALKGFKTKSNVMLFVSPFGRSMEDGWGEGEDLCA
jgi:hypothetical protein